LYVGSTNADEKLDETKLELVADSMEWLEQPLEAEQRAAECIRKMRKIPPSSIENPPNASTA
jgi:hypothetical protein